MAAIARQRAELCQMQPVNATAGRFVPLNALSHR
jgi:hypothetical protein